ncbi:MAG: serine protein kinase RIO [Psychromonas sp.]|nr:serine protein kinase RIO [Psychromonas sp.]
MKTPQKIQPLIDDGLVDTVLKQLMSGKEATIYVVQCGGSIRCAKVYKDANQRSFKKATLYNEGRKVRNGRRARAMDKGSKYGRQQQEEIWQHAEVDALYKLAEAGVRVPKPFGCFNGVLLMELMTDEDGFAAPRLNDVSMSKDQAIEDHLEVIGYIVRMLIVGIIHGDLSEFNVLVDEWGPIIIDLPQAVNASGNNNAKKMFLRDVNNMKIYYGKFAPQLLQTTYGEEIWALYQTGLLTEDVKLTGKFKSEKMTTDLASVLEEIEATRIEHERNEERIKLFKK